VIIGKGDIGCVLKSVDRPEVLYFASGVSNSKATDIKEYNREMELLNKFDGNGHCVYFSSLSIYYSDSIYALHKRAMEVRVRNRFATSTIVRLGNISWGSNKNTIINWFKLCYEKGIQPELKDTYRHIISKEEFLYWMGMIKVGEKDIMNIPGEMVHVKEIWRRVTNGEY
jgi:hypothetical protein